MNLTINDKSSISAVQEEFNSCFPYLKLEFFLKPHKPGGATAREYLIPENKTIGECRTVRNKGKVKLLPGMSVLELEQSFRDIYGLAVQVFRKSGKVWLETTVTDNWTLEEQNRQGEELSKLVM